MKTHTHNLWYLEHEDYFNDVSVLEIWQKIKPMIHYGFIMSQIMKDIFWPTSKCIWQIRALPFENVIQHSDNTIHK